VDADAHVLCWKNNQCGLGTKKEPSCRTGPPAYVACMAACRYDNPVPPRFQATIDLWGLDAGISEQSMGARNRVGIGLSYRLARGGNLSPAIWGLGSRNQVGIGLSYRPASLCSLATQFQTRFLESIPRHIEGLKFPTLAESIPCN
jgi:hypothetical protein